MRKRSLRRFLRHEAAAANVEYVILVAGLAAVLVVAYTTFGDAVRQRMDRSSSSVAKPQNSIR